MIKIYDFTISRLFTVSLFKVMKLCTRWTAFSLWKNLLVLILAIYVRLVGLSCFPSALKCIFWKLDVTHILKQNTSPNIDRGWKMNLKVYHFWGHFLQEMEKSSFFQLFGFQTVIFIQWGHRMKTPSLKACISIIVMSLQTHHFIALLWYFPLLLELCFVGLLS